MLQIHITDLVVKQVAGVRKWLHAQAGESQHPVAYSARLSKGFLFYIFTIDIQPCTFTQPPGWFQAGPLKQRPTPVRNSSQDSSCRQLHMQLPQYDILCTYSMCFHPQQFVQNALSNSFYWQSAWRSYIDGGIVAIQILNWYIYIPTYNPSPKPNRFSNIRGKAMGPTLLGNLKDSLATWLKCFLVIALRCANEKLSSSRRLVLSYAGVCAHNRLPFLLQLSCAVTY